VSTRKPVEPAPHNAAEASDRTGNGGTRETMATDAEEVLKKNAARVTPEDVEKTLRNADAIRRQFEKKGPLGKFIDDVRVLLSMVQDTWSHTYRDVPYWTIAAVVAALLYVINPFDAIPDAIPIVGQLDDAAVVAACLALVRRDLQRYREWKLARQGAEPQ